MHLEGPASTPVASFPPLKLGHPWDRPRTPSYQALFSRFLALRLQSEGLLLCTHRGPRCASLSYPSTSLSAQGLRWGSSQSH